MAGVVEAHAGSDFRDGHGGCQQHIHRAGDAIPAKVLMQRASGISLHDSVQMIGMIQDAYLCLIIRLFRTIL